MAFIRANLDAMNGLIVDEIGKMVQEQIKQPQTAATAAAAKQHRDAAVKTMGDLLLQAIGGR